MLFESRYSLNSYSKMIYSARRALRLHADKAVCRLKGPRSSLWSAVVTTACLAMPGNTFAQTIDPSVSIDEFRAIAEGLCLRLSDAGRL